MLFTNNHWQYSNGETESILGRILPGIESGTGAKAELATKAAPWSSLIKGTGGVHGVSGGAGGLAPDMLRLQLETSLKRLQVDKVALFYLHAPDTDTPLEATLLEVKKLHEEGKFEALGLSNYSAWETTHVWHLCDKLGVVKPTVYQGMYNGITRQVEVELFPCLRRLGMRFLAYNPLAGGLLTGKHRFDKPPAAGRFKGNDM
jgi:aflatoxin B1 aldehyde reductase